MSKTAARAYLLILVFAGVAALGFVTFGESSLSTAYQTFEGVYKAGIRKGALALAIAVVVIGVLASLIALILSFLKRDRFEETLVALAANTRKRTWVRALLVIFTLIFLLAGQLSVTASCVEDSLDRIFLETMRPVFLWVCFLSFLVILVHFSLSGGFRKKGEVAIVRALGIFGIFILLWVGISLSGYGYRTSSPQGGVFRVAGYPILGYQVFFAWAGTFLWMFIVAWLRKGKGGTIPDWGIEAVILLLLFFGAFFSWRGVPIKPNAFIDLPRPPNYEYYPALDAIVYDRTAQNLLATGSYQSYLADGSYAFVGRRPLLAFFYGVLHASVGLGYEDVIPYQLAVFAFLPVLIYLFTKTLANRAAGILTAALMIIRLRNGLLLSGEVTGTSLHMVMSDIPATMGVVLILYLTIIWMKRSVKTLTLPLLIGGLVGGTMLIRQEAVIMVSVFGIAAWISLKKRWGYWIKSLLVLSLGIFLVISPWMVRNWQQTGRVYIDSPEKFTLVTRTWGYFTEDRRVSSVTPEEHVTDVQEPISRIELLANHFTNSAQQSILYLPSRWVMVDVDYLSKFFSSDLKHTYGGILYDIEKYVRLAPYWRRTWDGRLTWMSVLPISLILYLMAGGISILWQRRGWLTLLPILAFSAHVTIYALVRQSGGRYLLEVDWIPAMFYCVGLVEGTKWGMGKGREILGKVKMGKKAYTKPLFLTSEKVAPIILVTFGLLSFGIMPVLVEWSLPNRYSQAELEGKVTYLLEDPDSPFDASDQKLLRSFLNDGGESILGRSLYPRYFHPGEEFIDTIEFYFKSSTTFYVSGVDVEYAVLPGGSPPEYFPHGSDVVVFGCPQIPLSFDEEQVCLHCFNGGFDVLAVVIYDPTEEGRRDVLWREGEKEGFAACPLPSPEGW